jgi:DNA-3-methyladenine glycosylase I
VAVAATEAVMCDDGLRRCPWAVANPLNRDYHDTEWGRPVHGEQALFERISLEGFQAGLSWLTILTKRPAFRAAFSDFDPEVVAGFTDSDVERLMADSTIVRNRAKIEAARTNARATIALRTEGGLDALIWSHRGEPAPKALAAELKSRGFVFVGPTTAEALMQAIGMLDAHVEGCHRRGVAAGL